MFEGKSSIKLFASTAPSLWSNLKQFNVLHHWLISSKLSRLIYLLLQQHYPPFCSVGGYQQHFIHFHYFYLKTLILLVVVKEQSSHLVYNNISTYAWNNKPVKIWAQLVFCSEVSKSSSWKTTSLQREPFLTMFLYYQPLPITCYQVRSANNYFE